MAVVLRRVALAALLLVVAFASVTAATVSRGQAAMRSSDRAFDRGQLREAIGFAKRAAAAYVPGAPHVRDAHRRLAAIAKGSESIGREDVAREAWEASRAALLETRHVWTPYPELLHRADQNVARLLSRAGAGRQSDPTRDELQRLLAEDRSPRTPVLVALLGGFLLAISGVALLALGALTPSGELRPRRARIAGILTVLGVACWTIAVYRA